MTNIGLSSLMFLGILGICLSAEQQTGFFYAKRPTEGFTLYSTAYGTNTYLIDNDGQVVHEWVEPDGLLGISAYLSEKATLIASNSNSILSDMGVGAGCHIREYALDGTCLWEFRYSGSDFTLHHDFTLNRKGNIIATAWETHANAEALAKGYTVNDEDYVSNTILEVKRWGKPNPNYDPAVLDGDLDNTCKRFSDESDIIWKWDSFDHVSDDISDPFTYDINKPFGINGIDILLERNHIAFACKECHEIFIINHSVPADQTHTSAGHFLFRWGNPNNYGIDRPQQGGAPHGIFWVRNNFGYRFPRQSQFCLTFYNNEDPETAPNSSAVQLTPFYLGRGKYRMLQDGAFGPSDFDVKIDTVKRLNSEGTALEEGHIRSVPIMGMAQKLPNGRFFVLSGLPGEFLEVKYPKVAIWRYVNPHINNGLLVGPKDPDTTLDQFEEVEPGPIGYLNSVFIAVRYSKNYRGIRKLLYKLY